MFLLLTKSLARKVHFVYIIAHENNIRKKTRDAFAQP